MLQEAKDVVARIRTSLDISEDKSHVLLVAYHWDEQKIVNFLSFSSEAMMESLGLVSASPVELSSELRHVIFHTLFPT